MTEFILIRHGKTDYNLVTEKGFKGHGLDLSFLSDEGIKQANNVAINPIINNSNVLISSPYTRCMQTASIISNKLNLPIIGEIDLHEWLPDLSFNYQSGKTAVLNYNKAIQDYLNSEITSKEYESIYSVQIRALKVLKKYLQYEKVLVVTHGGVMYSLTGKQYKHCEIESIKFDGKTLIKNL